MAGEWPVLTLREAGVQLIDCEHRTPPPADEGYPYVAIPQVKGGRLDLSDARLISHEHFVEWTRKASPQQWDVIVSWRCNPGEAAVVPAGLQCALAQNLVLLRADGSRVAPEFLRWLVRSPTWWEQVQTLINVGAVFDSLKCADIPHFMMPIPPLAEQRAIAQTLGTLDDKIELNRRMNEMLEGIARAIFKSWFIDFDPVHRNAARRRNQPSPAASRHPLPMGEGWDEGAVETLDRLFPDSFEDSDLGQIPAGWEVKPLSEFTTAITKGTTPTQEGIDTAPEGGARIKYVRVNAIGEDGAILFDKLTTIPELVHRGVLKRSVLRVNDVLYTIAGTIGRISVVEVSLLPANTNQAVAIIRPKPAIPSDFLVFTMRQEAFREELHSNIVHAVQANLSLGMLSRARAVVPPMEMLPQLFRPIDDVVKRILANRTESRTLAALRDTLLPKLISGELRVKDAERFIEGRD